MGKTISVVKKVAWVFPVAFIALGMMFKMGLAISTQTGERSKFSTRGQWIMVGGQGINGSWAADRFDMVRGLAVYKGDLFASLSGPKEGDAQVWRFDGSKWEQVAGDGVRRSWPTGSKRRVNALLSDGGHLHAGVGSPHRLGAAEVWRFDGQGWELIGGKGLKGSWGPDKDDIAYTLAVLGGDIYVGLLSEDTGGRAYVYRYDGKRWIRIAGKKEFGSWAEGEGYQGIFKLFVHEGHLYAATWGRLPGTSDIWRFNGQKWEQVGGDEVRGSWKGHTVGWIESLASHQGKLIAALVSRTSDFGSAAPIWGFDGNRWQPVAGDRVSASWNESKIFRGLIVHEGSLCVGTGGKAGTSSLWKLQDGDRWEQIAGRGLNGSWGASGPLTKVGKEAFEWVDVVTIHNGDLVVGLAGYPGAAQVWRYRRNN